MVLPGCPRRQGLLDTWRAIRKSQGLPWSMEQPPSPSPCVGHSLFHHKQSLQCIEDRGSWGLLSLAPLKCHLKSQTKRNCSALAQGTFPALHRKTIGVLGPQPRHHSGTIPHQPKPITDPPDSPHTQGPVISKTPFG